MSHPPAPVVLSQSAVTLSEDDSLDAILSPELQTSDNSSQYGVDMSLDSLFE